ncbi:endosomal/lysosomal proton channel TMEM175 isoform X6 [Erinaceus europaeus]|uniref:Endosomal/lysosomal proton channel TMEM175 n=1 Tax=Erinaceus europaeus TaxID=9365 RepID=A0ABM3X6B9_ERIEU|nr:endosomal/lysosomal proton channel TMEM175 isoform X6 [Erinaceus europaeus]
MSKKDSTISLCALQAGIQPPSCGSEPQVPTGLIMSGSPTLEPPLDTQGDTSLSSRDEDVAGETQHSQRMLSFSDGLLSIIATVMILPVTHTEISPEQEFDKGVQKLLATRIAVYLMTFLIVTVAWAAHARLFQIVGKIDDTLALLNLACMMTITFLPFTFSLMVTFPEAPLGIFLFCMCVVAIGGVQPLRPDISPQGPVPQAHPGPCASGPCPVPPGCRLLPVLLPGGRRQPPAPHVDSSLDLSEALSKERVEAFSDGVYAIVATLLILDICPQPLQALPSAPASALKASAACVTSAVFPSVSSSARTTYQTPGRCRSGSAAAFWRRWVRRGPASWPISAPSPQWGCCGSRTTPCSCTCGGPRPPWGCSTRCRWPSWAAFHWPTSRRRPSHGGRGTSWGACGSAAPSPSWPASSSSPCGQRPCCAPGRRCGPRPGWAAPSTPSCSPSWHSTPAPACWPSLPPWSSAASVPPSSTSCSWPCPPPSCCCVCWCA